MLDKILNIFFPESCPVCGASSSDHRTAPICPVCWYGIKPYEGTGCLKCGRPFVSGASTTCSRCLQNEPDFEYAESAGMYEGTLKKAINLFKYHNIKRLSRPLSDILFRINIPDAEIIMPVPLYKKRLRQRGFNQSALLARHLADRTGICLDIHSLVKTKDTAPQVGLSSADRSKNLRNAFALQDAKAISGKRILLVDDVITTGATTGECSRVLKKSGARKVYVAALAYGTGGYS